MEQQETIVLITSCILIMLIAIIIALFLIFQKRKNSLLMQQKEAQKKFEAAIAETQIEIREETLRNISWELHDNIGQLLTLAKIQVSIAKDDPNKLQEVTETITKSLTELRSLSKLINPDAIKKLNLTEAITLEIERFNRIKFINASISYNEEIQPLDDKIEIIIFRILQEFFTNTIKHSKASNLEVKLHYDDKKMVIHAQDDGIGFKSTSSNAKKGIGLSNIQTRCKLIGAKVKIDSEEGKGTAMTLTYYYNKKSLTSIKNEVD